MGWVVTACIWAFCHGEVASRTSKIKNFRFGILSETTRGLFYFRFAILVEANRGSRLRGFVVGVLFDRCLLLCLFDLLEAFYIFFWRAFATFRFCKFKWRLGGLQDAGMDGHMEGLTKFSKAANYSSIFQSRWRDCGGLQAEIGRKNGHVEEI